MVPNIVILVNMHYKFSTCSIRHSSSMLMIQKIVFLVFTVVWSLYGVFYHANEAIKLIGYNMLDLIAKAFVGIFFWLYLTKSVIF